MAVQGDSLGVATLTLAADPVPLDTMLASAQKRTEASMASMEAMSGKRLATVGQNMSRLGSQWTRTVSLPIVGGGAAMIKVASDFEGALTQVQTQAGASAREIENMRAAILKLAPAVGQTPVALANALYHIESAGIRSSKALDVLTQSAKLAQIGHSNLEQTTSALVAVMKSAPKDVKNATDAIGIMNAVVGQGNMRMGDLVGALSTGIIPAAKSAGLGLRDVGAALDVMTSRGVPAQAAATRLRMTIALLSAPTSKAATELKGIGLSSTQLAEDMRKPDGLVIAVQDLKTHLDKAGLSATQQNQVIAHAFGGGRSSAGILTLLQNTGDLQKAFDGIGKHSGAAQVRSEWKKTQEDLGVRMDKLKAKAEVAFVDIGTKIAPEFLKVGTQVADDAAKIASAFSSLPKGAQDLIITGGLTAAALGPVMRLAGVLTTFVGRTWDALKIAQELATGKRMLLGGLTSKASGKVGSAVATMEVGEMIVKTMIGGGGPGIGGGGSAVKTAEKDAAKVGGGAAGAGGLRAAIGADISVGEVAPYLAPLLLAGLFGTNYKDAAKAAIGNLSQTVKGVLSSAELKNLGASAGVGTGSSRFGAFPWTPDTLKLIKQADIALAQFASTGNARGLDRVKVSAAALAKQWPANASEMRSLIKVMNAAERGALPGIARASQNAGDTITTKFADKMSAARDVVKNSTGDARKYAIQNFTRLQNQASSAFDGLERKVASSQSKMTASIRSGSKNLADVAWKNFGSFQASVKNAMTAGVLDASKGAQLVAEALNSTLKALGAGTIPVPALIHAADLAGMKGVGPSALLNPGGGAAQGALVQFGRRGDAGADRIPVNMGGQGIMVGSGEVGAVFTRHQFAAANQMLAGIGGLPGLFQQVDRPHYMAGGGFVSTAYGPPWGGIEGGGVTATGVDLRRGQKAYIIATDPSVIPTHSNVKVTPNPFGYTGTFRAEDTGGAIKGNRIDFYDWLGRASQNAWGRRDVTAEIVGHAFGGKVGAAIAGAVAQAIKAPGVSGHGAIATMVRAALGKVANAANRYEAAHMPASAAGGGTPGVGAASTFAGKGDYRMYRWPVPAGAPFTPGRVDRGQDFETSPHGVFDAIGDMIITSGATDFPGITGRLLAGPARGMQAFHGHTFESFVRAGQHVSAGQPLGRVGHQGQSYDGGVTHLELGFLTSAGQVAPPQNAAHYSYTGQEMHDLLEHIRPFSRGGFVNAAQGFLGNRSAGLTFGHPNYPKVLPLSTASPAILGLLNNLNSILDPNTGDVAKLQDRDQSLQNIFGLTPFGNINTAGDAIVTPADGSMPYIDQGLVGGRVKQLTQLFGLEVGARNELQFALKLIAPLLIRLRNAIEARRKRIERIKAKIRANLRKIKGLLDLIKAERHRKLPGDHKARAAARKESAKRITGWDSQIRGIKDENAQLGGNRDSIGSGGEIGALAGQISTLQTDLGNVIGDQQGIVGPSGIGGSLGAAKITVEQRQQDLAALSAPAQGLALAAAVSSATGAGAGTAGASALDALDQQKIDELSQRLAVSQDQYRVLSQLPAFGGSFAAGGIVPGMLGEPRTIIAHGGEMVTPAGDGMLHEHNVIFGPKTRWLEDFVDVRVEHKTRSISRAAKPLAGARAGQLGRR